MKPVTRALSLIVLLVAGCASSLGNPYAEFYQSTSGLDAQDLQKHRVSPPPATAAVERSAQPSDLRVLLAAYVKRGYVPIGYSLFNGGDRESDEGAVKQARAVGADLVVILNPSYGGSVTSVAPASRPTSTTSGRTQSLSLLNPYAEPDPVVSESTTPTYGRKTTYVPVTTDRYNYGAVYLVKRRFLFGAFWRDLNDADLQALQSNEGAVVIGVIDDSPAFNADVLTGDIIIRVDGVAVTDSKAADAMMEKRNGKQVTLTFVRAGERIEKSVQLNE